MRPSSPCAFYPPGRVRGNYAVAAPVKSTGAWVQDLGLNAVGSGSSVVLTLTAATTAGDTIVVVARGSSGALLTGVTDSAGNTYTVDTTAGPTDTIGIAHSVTTTALAATDTITGTWPASTSGGLGLAAVEYGGVTGVGAKVSTSAASSDTITVSLTNDYATSLLFAACASYGSTAFSTTPAGFTVRFNQDKSTTTYPAQIGYGDRAPGAVVDTSTTWGDSVTTNKAAALVELTA